MIHLMIGRDPDCNRFEGINISRISWISWCWPVLLNPSTIPSYLNSSVWSKKISISWVLRVLFNKFLWRLCHLNSKNSAPGGCLLLLIDPTDQLTPCFFPCFWGAGWKFCILENMVPSFCLQGGITPVCLNLLGLSTILETTTFLKQCS